MKMESDVQVVYKMIDVLEKEYVKDKNKWFAKETLYVHPELSKERQIDRALNVLSHKNIICSQGGKFQYCPPRGE